MEGNVTTQFDKAGQGRKGQGTLFDGRRQHEKRKSLQIPTGLTKNYFTSILPKLDWSKIANSYPYVVFLMGQTDSVVKMMKYYASNMIPGMFKSSFGGRKSK